jgi:hypothetical protein
VQAGIATGPETGGALGADIVEASQQAFLSGLHVAVLAAAAITALAAVGVFLWLPARAPAVEHPVVEVDDADIVDADIDGAGVPGDAVPAPEGAVG